MLELKITQICIDLQLMHESSNFKNIKFIFRKNIRNNLSYLPAHSPNFVRKSTVFLLYICIIISHRARKTFVVGPSRIQKPIKLTNNQIAIESSIFSRLCIPIIIPYL